MSATQAIELARAAGIQLEIDGDDLLLEAAEPPPADVLDLLSRHKADIMTLLRPAKDGWSAEDWQAFFDERAGIAEFAALGRFMPAVKRTFHATSSMSAYAAV